MMTGASTNPMQELGEAWAVIYPLIYWVINHPLASLVLILFGLYLLWVLLRALVYLTEKLWLKLIRFPLWAMQSLWAGRQLPVFRLKEESRQTQECDRLKELIDQLETTQKQQADLINLAREELRKIQQ